MTEGISIDPAVCHGSPVIAGTRVSCVHRRRCAWRGGGIPGRMWNVTTPSPLIRSRPRSTSPVTT